jgi:S-adenosylmethionine-diacylglycerol 3-amino-3-carboxypropyl transferase
VFAIDLNPAQLACLEPVAAYRTLTYRELLVLMARARHEPAGALPSLPAAVVARRAVVLGPSGAEIDRGIGGRASSSDISRCSGVGFCLSSQPPRHRSHAGGGTRQEREAFYRDTWDTVGVVDEQRMFFSRTVMGRFGRDPSFFRYVEGDVAGRILNRTRHALTVLDPAENPYIQWILTGRHASALPYALRPESFDVIRQHLDRLEWRCVSAEAFLTEASGASIDWFNLSDIFEYVSGDRFARSAGGGVPERADRAAGSRIGTRWCRARDLTRWPLRARSMMSLRACTRSTRPFSTPRSWSKR